MAADGLTRRKAVKYSWTMDGCGLRGSFGVPANGSVNVVPAITIEPRESIMDFDNGPFMKILTGDHHNKSTIIQPQTQQIQN
jgi:hypothetical protein